MARLTLSLEELVQIMIANGLFTWQIARVRVKGESIHFVIKTNSTILPFIPASLKYLSFDRGDAVFELTVVSRHAGKAIGRLSHMLEPKIPAYMRLEYPKLFVNIDKLLESKSIGGIRVKDIFYENGEFAIVVGKA